MDDFGEKIKELRQEYLLAELDELTAAKNPFEQFDKWFNESLDAGLNEANAMSLGTATPDGLPSVRIVLLKEYNQDGFIFYTNYSSRKGKELEKNPFAALTFFWPELQRQVRIEGKVEKLSPEKSDKYFQSRPRGSQIGAFASPQSEYIDSRQALEEKFQQAEMAFAGKTVSRPSSWGGYLVNPEKIEFWQGRLNRLHDRILYQRCAGNNNWELFRLAP